LASPADQQAILEGESIASSSIRFRAQLLTKETTSPML